MQLSIGLSALQASQKGLEITGHNIANASTPGYHQQVLRLSSAMPVRIDKLMIGRGVDVAGVRRVVNEQIEQSQIRQAAAAGASSSHLEAAIQLETRLGNPKASPGARLEELFNRLDQLSSQLNSSASRKLAVASANQLVNEFHLMAADLAHQREGLQLSVNALVDEVNPLLRRIGQLNGDIARLTNQGVEPNDLLDQRAQALQDLSQRIGIDVYTGNQGQLTVLADGVPLVISGRAEQLVVVHKDGGALGIQTIGTQYELPATAGQLGGLLAARDETLPRYQARLNAFAQEIVRSLNAVQTTGVGAAGAFTRLQSHESVTDITTTLDSAGLAIPVSAGVLTVALTNTATGERTLSQVSIDPAQQSLQDVAAALGEISHLQAFVNSQDGTLSLMASPGFTFDFRGGIDSQPTTAFSPGTTSAAALSGSFTEEANDNYTFTFLDSGTVGVTPGLRVQVTDQAGNTIATLDVGQGYEAGQPIAVANGVRLSLSSGDITSGDYFMARAIGSPDTANLLSSLGLNSFFTGRDAATIEVSGDLLDNADRLATSHTGELGDATNLQRLIALRDRPSMESGTITMSDYFIQTVADVGVDVQSLTEQRDTNQLLTDRLEQQRQSISGVDTNEEMINLLKYQRMFQVASKYISAVNDAYNELLSIR